MSDFDYFKQYQSEQARIKQKIQDEENPIHREHLVFIEEMIDNISGSKNCGFQGFSRG